MSAIGELFFYRGDGIDLDTILRANADRVRAQVDQVPEREFSNKTDDEIAAQVAAQLTVTPLEVDFAAAKPEVREGQVEVRDQFDGKTVRVPGFHVTKSVPFKGDKDLWFLKTNPWGMNPPRGRVQGNKIIVGISVTADQTDYAAGYIAETLAAIPEYLERQATQINAYNSNLHATALSWAKARRDRLSKGSDLLKKLGG